MDTFLRNSHVEEERDEAWPENEGLDILVCPACVGCPLDLPTTEDCALCEGDEDTWPNDDESDQFMSDVEADADALASAGFGTNEDYGDFGEDSQF